MNLKLTTSFEQRTYHYLKLAGPDQMRLDSEVTECRDCKTKFRFLITRKHHCKICGECFCDECSRERYPREIIFSGFDFSKTVRKDPDYFKEVWSPNTNAWHRVCKTCELDIKEKMKDLKLYTDVQIEKIVNARREVWRMLSGEN